MKALTLYQPWAQLIVDGRKRIETRSWQTKHTGLLAIHAAKSINEEACREFGYRPAEVPTGAVVAIAELIGCVKFTAENVKVLFDYIEDDSERAYGDFMSGRYGWLLTLVRKLEPPIPATGKRLLWNWEGSMESRQ